MSKIITFLLQEITTALNWVRMPVHAHTIMQTTTTTHNIGLGRGNHRTIMKLSKLNKLKNVLFLSKGLNSQHTFFVTKDYQIYCCGNNIMNQLGIPNDMNNMIKQEKLKAIKLKKTPFIKDRVKDICCGLMHSLFLTQSGKIYGIGGNEDGQIGLGKKCMEQQIEKFTLIKVCAIEILFWIFVIAPLNIRALMEVSEPLNAA